MLLLLAAFTRAERAPFRVIDEGGIPKIFVLNDEVTHGLMHSLKRFVSRTPTDDLNNLDKYKDCGLATVADVDSIFVIREKAGPGFSFKKFDPVVQQLIRNRFNEEIENKVLKHTNLFHIQILIITGPYVYSIFVNWDVNPHLLALAKGQLFHRSMTATEGFRIRYLSKDMNTKGCKKKLLNRYLPGDRPLMSELFEGDILHVGFVGVKISEVIQYCKNCNRVETFAQRKNSVQSRLNDACTAWLNEQCNIELYDNNE